jgi:hypothetical protein
VALVGLNKRRNEMYKVMVTTVTRGNDPQYRIIKSTVRFIDFESYTEAKDAVAIINDNYLTKNHVFAVALFK